LKFIFRNIVPFEKSLPVFAVFFRNAERTVKTIFAARRCQKLVVHAVFCFKSITDNGQRKKLVIE
jgi:hypothetical protein